MTLKTNESAVNEYFKKKLKVSLSEFSFVQDLDDVISVIIGLKRIISIKD